jgi:predicted P-loop ATPase
MAYSFADWQDGKKPPKGWDGADAVRDGWSKKEIDAFMRATAKPWVPETPPEKPVDERQEHPAPLPAPTPLPARPVREARTTQQARPEQATVTDIRTRVTVKADDHWKAGCIFNQDGTKLKPNLTRNWALYLEHHRDMAGVLAFDEFRLRVMLMKPPPWEPKDEPWTPRPIQDRDHSEAVMWLEMKGMTPKASQIVAVIEAVAQRHAFDPWREYLEGLKWDRTPRLETWLTYYLGVEDTPYARTVGVRWLVSSVARGLQPGCKVDTMPILEGPQGAQKSKVVRVLYDPFYSDNLSDIGSKDAKMEMQGVAGLEVAEMHKFSAAEVNEVKKFLSQQVDRFRPPYGRSIIEAPRRCIMIGTINPEGNAYLRDPTGARRFWPITVGKIDIEGIEADRDQLWAESVHLFKAGVPWWVQEDEQDAVVAEQEKRTDVDVWVDLIAPMLVGRKEIAQIDIIRELGIQAKDADWRHAGRIGRIMKKLGWSAHRDRRSGEDRVVFRRPLSADDW